MNRLVTALLALSVLAGTGAYPAGDSARGATENASGVREDASESAEELDPGIVRWLLRSRWWHGTPGRPAPPTVSDISHDSLTVSWMAPESEVFEIVDYDVQYRAGSAAGFADFVHDGTDTQATITGLAEVTEYQVRVRAVSEVGEGDWSAIASGTTLVSCHASSGASEFAMRVNARRGPQGISGIFARATTRQWRAWRSPEGRAPRGPWPRCAPWQWSRPFPAGTRLATDPVGRAEAS